MAKLFGEELRKNILENKQRAIKAIEDRNKRINDGLTDLDDCFISQRCNERAIQEANMQLDILSGDGLGEWEVIVDQNGDEVNARWVKTRYGYKIVANGIFAASKKALCKKTGWHTEVRRVPIWTKFCANASGLLGVYTGTVEIVRWHTNMVTGEYVGYPA
jgi:hypothetical protein